MTQPAECSRDTKKRRARDEEHDENQSAAPPAAHVSPAMRIYRHALEAIFAMLELGDLSCVLAVSREWSAAVRSMAPINASLEHDSSRSVRGKKAIRELPSIASIVGSPLLRHLAAIHIRQQGHDGNVCWTPLNKDSLGLLAQHAPNLTSLCCEFTFTPNEPLILPARLTSLTLYLDDESTDATTNRVLTALAALPSLSSLTLSLPAWFKPDTTVEVGLLGACLSLKDLTFGGIPELTPAQMARIHSSLGHLRRFIVGWTDSEELARTLQPPTNVRWQDIGSVIADARTPELLLRLPSLTKLNVSYRRNTAHVDFLPQLPLLRVLHLDCHSGGGWFIPTDALLASLVLCTSITELNLCCGFDSADWSALFAKLTKIKKLTIRRCSDMETLQRFASGPVTDSLEELTLEELSLSLSELPHLYGLRRLRTLYLDRCFDQTLPDVTFDSLSPLTPLIPVLTKLCYQQWGTFLPEGHGSSFEWMQQRMAQ